MKGQRQGSFCYHVLRRVFGPKREEVAGGWRRLHNEEVHNLYASPNIIRVIISRRVRWVVRVAHIRDGNRVQNFGRKTRRGETIRKT
jgi:hypothetical protein